MGWGFCSFKYNLSRSALTLALNTAMATSHLLRVLIYDGGDMHDGTDGTESGDVLLGQKLMVTMVGNASETGLLQS